MYDEEIEYDWIPNYGEISYRICQRVPIEVFQQDKVWMDSKKRLIAISSLENGHLDNVINWIKQHANHWDGRSPVLLSPLMRALEAEQKRRIPKRNATPRQALKDVMLNDSVIARAGGPPPIDSVVTRIIGGLGTRGFEIVRKKS